MTSYIGRFAPSPTGPLHFGSLLAATASYLEARSQQGHWLLRMEDLDKPREQPGAADRILKTLAAYGFTWDREVVYQSQRLDAYQAALEQLQPHCYACQCSRKQWQALAPHGPLGPIYPGTCRHRPPNGQPDPACAIRIRVPAQSFCLDDAVQGHYCQQLDQDVGDFVIRRADGLFAYQLAVVVDDAWQGITHVVRGSDLLDNTPRQLFLQQCLHYPAPHYLHIPVADNAHGQKLSKQTQAPALPTAPVHTLISTLCQALQFLGQAVPPADEFGSVDDVWQWAIAHWSSARIPRALSFAFNTR
ncbi:MAG: tRNA glutamyl-Q(34) synthetase GluQRS [Thiolinea sp.]